MWVLIGTVSRWLVFAGLLTAVGAVTFKVVVLPREGTSPEDGLSLDVSRVAARIGRLAIALVALGALGRLAAEISVFRDPFEPLGAELGLLVGQTSFGRSWVGQVIATVMAMAGFGLAAASRPRTAELGWFLSTAAVVLLAYTPAFSGHAAGAEHWVTAAISADVFHVVAGGMWLGTLAVMAGVVRAGIGEGQPVPRERIIGWIAVFSPIALGAAAVLSATGVFAAWLHLDAVSALWADPYGRRLSLKLLIVTVILSCGAYNWKRSRGRVAASGDPPRLPPSTTIELAAGLALLLVTAILVTTPPPAH